MKLSWLFPLLLLGCMSPLTADVVDDGVIVDPVQPDESDAGNAISFSMNDEQFASLATWLGKSNSVVFEKPFHVEAAGTTIDAKAGTRFDYELGDGSGAITFAKPFPTVKAGIAKLIGGVSLHSIDLNSDGTGTAATGLGRYKIRWAAEDEDAGAAAAESLPELWYWSHEGCPPCARFESDYTANKESALFKPVKKTGERPTWMPESDPQFWWHTSGSVPTQADVANTRHQNGYQGWKDLVGKFDHSRSPKRFQRAGSPAADPFARSDLASIGSRSVARIAINGDFTPGRGTLLDHLSNDGIHRGRHDRRLLDALTTEQLRWLHDRDHGK